MPTYAAVLLWLLAVLTFPAGAVIQFVNLRGFVIHLRTEHRDEWRRAGAPRAPFWDGGGSRFPTAEQEFHWQRLARARALWARPEIRSCPTCTRHDRHRRLSLTPGLTNQLLTM